jgi:hypothetical protein
MSIGLWVLDSSFYQLQCSMLVLEKCNLVNFPLCVQALDTIKKSASSMPKDDAKRLEKEVSN